MGVAEFGVSCQEVVRDKGDEAVPVSFYWRVGGELINDTASRGFVVQVFPTL